MAILDCSLRRDGRGEKNRISRNWFVFSSCSCLSLFRTLLVALFVDSPFHRKWKSQSNGRHYRLRTAPSLVFPMKEVAYTHQHLTWLLVFNSCAIRSLITNRARQQGRSWPTERMKEKENCSFCVFYSYSSPFFLLLPLSLFVSSSLFLLPSFSSSSSLS